MLSYFSLNPSDLDEPFTELTSHFASCSISSKDDHLLQNPIVEAGIAATAAGGVDTVVTGMTHPFLVRKIRSQDPKIPELEKATWNPRILFRGAGPNMFSMVPITTIQFCTNEGFKTAFHQGGEDIPTINQIGYSVGAGAFSSLVGTPVEFCIAWQNESRGFFKTGNYFINNYGIRTLWTGLTATAIRDGKYVVGYQCLAPYLTTQYMNFMPLIPAQVAGGVTAGLVSALISHPFDAVRSRYQLSNCFENKSSTLMPRWNGIQKEMRKEGWRAIATGIKPRMGGIVVTSAILNTVGEQVQSRLKKHHQKPA